MYKCFVEFAGPPPVLYLPMITGPDYSVVRVGRKQEYAIIKRHEFL